MKIQRKLNALLLIFTLMMSALGLQAQGNMIKGQILDVEAQAVPFANVVLYEGESTQMVKAEVSDLEGNFIINDLLKGQYKMQITFIGLEDKNLNIDMSNEDIDLGEIELKASGFQIETAVVTARRALVEVKADKTVFNVEGTINSAGDNALGLLRKAPGVLLDNNDNITVLGRSGVQVFVDGKKLPLSGEELSSYLASIPSEQIDRFDIISNPGARFDAEGNAGIIDIRLKKNKNFGSNGTLSSSVAQGRFNRRNIDLNLNTRRDKFNVYGSLGYNYRKAYSDIFFTNEQNGFFLDESNLSESIRNRYNGKLGVDFFINENSTIGFLVSGGIRERIDTSTNRIELSPLHSRQAIDSILVAHNFSEGENTDQTYNLNYAYNNKGFILNMDLDYGRYRKQSYSGQPNTYYDASEQDILSYNRSAYETPVNIDIYTFKLDIEQPLFKGQFGYGAKMSVVNTDNTYEFFNVIDDVNYLVNSRSNNFIYLENVAAAYLSYSRQLNKKFSLSAGVRAEYTDSDGDLSAYDPELQEDPVILNYIDYFPSAGISYNLKPGNTINLNYGRRLNRPDYNVLNPFREQLSELSFKKGNAFLDPEIVNNFEIGYTHAYRYNFKVSYSKTVNEITRLIGPDDIDPRASFLSYDNLATKEVYALNIALPLEVTNWWNAFFNLSGSHINNQADYGGGAIVDLQAWTYNIYTQQTFKLPFKISGEISGWFNGPGIWGGVFEYDTSWSLNLGLQRKFLNNKLNVKLSGDDLFYQSGWSGVSSFNGLTGYGKGNWDSRRVSLSVSYKFGNSKIKSRNRKTGIDEESKRVSD